MSAAEFNPMDPQLEKAMQQIRDDAPDSAVVEAAAARVWARLAEAASAAPHEHIRGCADFQAMLPDYRAGHLPVARATLLEDHLHECVACRKVYEGRVTVMPAARPARRPNYTVRWAAAAVVVAAAGLSVWVAVDQFGGHVGRAIVQTVNGNLYEVSAAGIKPLLAGQDLPDGIEIRTANDSDAMLQLHDGSVVELRERSGVSATRTASDLTLHLSRGSVIVQAAKRRRGHLYVATPDFRVAVTGTVFSVSSGVKGSRVSVIQGEVHVSQNNEEKVLHPGDQAVTGATLEPVSVREDISWSRNRDRLMQQLDALKVSLQKIHMPALRYDSALLKRLPANVVFFASIPNLSQYLGEAQTVFHQKLAENPELRAWWAGRSSKVEPVIEKLRTASEYLGDEVVVVAVAGADGGMEAPVFVAETRREGFPEFVRQQRIQAAVVTRPGLVVFGPAKASLENLAGALDAASGSFQGTPFYNRIASAYHEGAGLLLCADLSRLSNDRGPQTASFRYFVAEQKDVQGQMETRAAVDFNGPRTGIAAWLAEPSPMGSLDYISPEATLVAAFVVKSPAAIVDEVAGVQQRSPAAARQAIDELQQKVGFDVRADLAASLGGEFSISLDGPPFPVPSWKLVAECYDPARLQATLQKFVDTYNQQAVKAGHRPLRTSQETVEGRAYYMLAGGDPNPLTEAHYTFADGYLIAGPSRALVSRALQVKASGTSITHSARFLEMEPRDHYANFSALIYQDLGTTLAPLTSLLGAFASRGGQGAQNALQGLGNMKPMLLAAYGAPDRITVAGGGALFGSALNNVLSGNVLGLVGNGLPFGQMMGTRVR
jgi:ferric-dicitrate binding protein FerR (iron transport regulator)